jgi:hypothetical protein
LQQFLDGGAVLGVPDDAEARLDGQGGAVERDLPGQVVPHPVQQREHPGRRELGQDEAELVAAEPRDGVVGADGVGQPGGDHLQQLVAGVVAEGVVDLLEPVQVDQHDGAR